MRRSPIVVLDEPTSAIDAEAEAELFGRLQQIAAGATTLDAGGRCVIPGFVDSHTHPVFAGGRAGEFAALVAGRGNADKASRSPPADW